LGNVDGQITDQHRIVIDNISLVEVEKSDTGESDTGESDTGESDTGESDTRESDTGESDTTKPNCEACNSILFYTYTELWME